MSPRLLKFFFLQVKLFSPTNSTNLIIKNIMRSLLFLNLSGRMVLNLSVSNGKLKTGLVISAKPTEQALYALYIRANFLLWIFLKA